MTLFFSQPLSLQPPTTFDSVPQWWGEQPAGGMPETDAACGVAGGWEFTPSAPLCCPAYQVCASLYDLISVLF